MRASTLRKWVTRVRIAYQGAIAQHPDAAPFDYLGVASHSCIRASLGCVCAQISSCTGNQLDAIVLVSLFTLSNTFPLSKFKIIKNSQKVPLEGLTYFD